MISGFVDPDFGGVTQALRRIATHKRGGGAAVAVFHRGALVVDAWTGARDASGAPWQSDTMAMSFSTTKGVIARRAASIEAVSAPQHASPQPTRPSSVVSFTSTSLTPSLATWELISRCR